MQLFSAPNPAPNPRRVRIFLAEKGVHVPETPLDLVKRDHKSDAHRERNSLGQVPTLVLDDGVAISETVSICRYFEELYPDPVLFGRTPVERALTDMWIRRVEFVVMAPVGGFWRHAHPRTAKLLTQYRDYGESNRDTFKSALKWLDGELDGRAYVAGPDYGMADICLQTTLDFAVLIGLEVDPALQNVSRWRDSVASRPSADA